MLSASVPLRKFAPIAVRPTLVDPMVTFAADNRMSRSVDDSPRRSNNCLFQSYVQEKLDALRGQFDLKYWPSLGDFMRELASDAEKAEMAATDPLTAAATAATRPSKADFFKALFASIEENSTENYGQLPRAFKLTDRTLASLANCALDLGPDELVDEAYVKRLRQRERNGTE